MLRRPMCCLLFSVLWIGCATYDSQLPPVTQPDKNTSPEGQPYRISDQNEKPSPSGGFEATHTIDRNVAYYQTDSQQGNTPGGEFQQGTVVEQLETVGSYAIVRTEKSENVYVTADALSKIKARTPVKRKTKAGDNVKSIVDGNNQFAIDLYRELGKKDGNLFFSPTSISAAFAMTYAGAGGNTEAEMARTFHFELPQNQLHPAFGKYIHGQTSRRNADYRLDIANRLWGQQGFDFNGAFLNTTRTDYGAKLAEVDFIRDREQARQTINRWVEKKTNRKIVKLFAPNSFDEWTRLVLTNAVYFKGNWLSKFDPSLTKAFDFRGGTNSGVKVPMMHQENGFPYFENERFQMISMPYGKSKDLAMFVLLPKTIDGLAELESVLSADNIEFWTKKMKSKEVRLYLPRFKMNLSVNLVEVLRSMGMIDPFERGRADFSGICRERLYISKAIHKAFVDVNEQGTEAAAATGIGMSLISNQETQTEIFLADHPFVFMIRDQRNGNILFLGRMVNPNQ